MHSKQLPGVQVLSLGIWRASWPVVQLPPNLRNTAAPSLVAAGLQVLASAHQADLVCIAPAPHSFTFMAVIALSPVVLHAITVLVLVHAACLTLGSEFMR